MTNTDILLEDLEDVLDDATSIPLSKKYAVDVDKIKTCLLYTSSIIFDTSFFLMRRTESRTRQFRQKKFRV